MRRMFREGAVRPSTDIGDCGAVTAGAGASAAVADDAPRRVLLAGLAALVATLVLVGVLAHLPGGAAAPAGAGAASDQLASSRVAVSRLLGVDEHAFWARRSAGGVIVARNTHQQLTFAYGRSGVLIRSPWGTAGIALARFGRGAALAPAEVAAPVADANRVSYARGRGVVEWYANGPLGLEQGLTLARATATGSTTRAPLRFVFALSGSLRAQLSGGVVRFGRAGHALRYLGLSATDAAGRSLPARILLHGQQLTILVDDAGAHYPVTIDPTVQGVQLTGSDSVTGDMFGYSTAQSATGSLVVIGAPGAKIGTIDRRGAVYVFAKPAAGWANATQTAKLTAADGASYDNFGYAVAIVGTTIAVGAPDHAVGSNTYEGAVYVFRQPAGGWTNASGAVELAPSDGAPNMYFGQSLAAAGSQLFVGAVYAGAGAGAVYEFNAPSAGWTAGATQTAKLTASDTSAGLGQALAADGTTVVAGTPYATIGTKSYQGAAYVFTEPAGGWRNETQTAKLTASDGGADDFLGISVAINSSTGTIAAGAPNHTVGTTYGAGAVYVFQEPSSGWATGTQTAEMTSSTAAAGTGLGHTVAITNKAGTGAPVAPAGASRAHDTSPPTITGWNVAVVGGSSNGQGLTVWNPTAGAWQTLDAGTSVELPVYGTSASPYSVSLGPGLMIIGNNTSTGNAVLVPGAPSTNPCPTTTAADAAVTGLGRGFAGGSASLGPVVHPAIYIQNCNNYYANKSNPLLTALTYVTGGIAVVSGGISAVAAETTKDSAALLQPEVAWPAFCVALGSGIIAFGAHAINNDPPDSHYRSLAKAVIGATPHAPGGNALSASELRFLAQIAAEKTKADAYVAAATTSIDRAGSAATAKSNLWLGRQTRAALGFFASARVILVSLKAQSGSLETILGKLSLYRTTVAHLQAMGAAVKTHGLPAKTLEHLHTIHASAAEIRSIEQNLAALSTLTGTGTVAHLLAQQESQEVQDMISMIDLYRSFPPVIVNSKL